MEPGPATTAHVRLGGTVHELQLPAGWQRAEVEALTGTSLVAFSAPEGVGIGFRDSAVIVSTPGSPGMDLQLWQAQTRRAQLAIEPDLQILEDRLLPDGSTWYCASLRTEDRAVTLLARHWARILGPDQVTLTVTCLPLTDAQDPERLDAIAGSWVCSEGDPT